MGIEALDRWTQDSTVPRWRPKRGATTFAGSPSAMKAKATKRSRGRGWVAVRRLRSKDAERSPWWGDILTVFMQEPSGVKMPQLLNGTMPKAGFQVHSVIGLAA
jgi:hypothetical protein